MISASLFSDKWPIVKLGDVVNFLDHKRVPVTKADRTPGDYQYYGANGSQGTINDYIFDEPLVLLAEDGGNFGHETRSIAYIARGKYWVNNHAHVLQPKECIDLEYLFRVLARYDVTPFIKGATRAKLSKTDASRIPIPLPPLETQKQIAEVLEKADQLREDCQQMEQELNSLAQSVFIDMFGDPVTNPKGWDMKALSDLAIIVTGNTPSRAKPEYYGSYIEWIKSGNINTPSDYLTIAEEYLSESGKKVGRVVQSGSVLMTCIAGSPDCIGNVAIADREVAFNQQINALVPIEKKLNTDFLYILLKVAKKIIQSASTNSMKGMISKSKLESIQLPFPSYDEQCDFSAIYRKLQKVVKEQQKQVIETELMFNSLMQKAFKGELTL
ncbi:restriction endonuclease subunit S [Vibrio cholerae]|uniref:restriction endonuclease subunit S n=1 Tax=Vibrio cholerae TaxID=666 RepID=UPI0011D5AEC4|nr:restriction endonuclease subunit S [Vibrio cholerae]EGZ6890271.1 restriction endonuclease subunit S [Vibrio cholerae]TXX71354.1 restriction endonuclease subunit S [Vibrio cholerae]GHZ28600.1 restriction endonuclease subunit S [Vibrio cholerae]